MNKTGYVYIIRCGDTQYFKIGKTCISVWSRLQSLQTGCPFALSVYFQMAFMKADVVESILHQSFEDKRIRGEWFELSQVDIGDLISRLAVEFIHNKELERESDIQKINGAGYHVPVVFGDYDADDVRAYQDLAQTAEIGELR